MNARCHDMHTPPPILPGAGQRRCAGRDRRGRTLGGFTMAELLVVIAIIAVLAGILLVAMKGVRSRAYSTRTESTMQNFMTACDTFQIEHGRYPGIVPEAILATNSVISSTENALLDLMGGAVRGDDPRYDKFTTGWQQINVDSSSPIGRLKINRDRIGEGPTVNGTPHAPYLTPGDREMVAVEGQAGGSGGIGGGGVMLPDLVDAWGQPLLYIRRARPSGPLAGNPGDNPQFFRDTSNPYTGSQGLGELGKNQTPSNGNKSFSILNASGDNGNLCFAQVLRHPSFGGPDEALAGTARGSYAVISAGPDGVYFSATDGPGTPGEPIDDWDDFLELGPTVIDEFDDLRRFGGG